MAAAPAPPRTVRRDSTPLPATVPPAPAPGSAVPAPGSAVPAPGSAVPAPGSAVPAPGSAVPAPGSAVPAAGFPAPAASARAVGENLAVILTPGLGGIIFASTAGLLTITPLRCADGCTGVARSATSRAADPGRPGVTALS